MSRTLKQILYGLLYLGLFAVVLWIVIPRNVEVATCTDNIQNQDEVGMDCGGSCEECELKDLRLEIGGVDILQVGDRSTLLVKVENPSDNFGVLGVPYRFEVTGALGESIEIVEGELNMADGEEKYIAAVGLDIKTTDIEGVTFSLDDFEFIPEIDLLGYDIEIEDVKVSFPAKTVQINGIAINDSGSEVSQVIITAVLYTPEGDLANVGTVLLSNIVAFEKRDFLISIPSTDVFVDLDQTEISWRII